MKGSVSNENLEIEGNSNLQDELQALLLQQQNRNSILERERFLDINRSGSAPPTIADALCASGSGVLNHVRNSNASTEEEIRSHPGYIEYYYSNHNLNPRLPLPLISKEDWRVAQRLRAASSGFGLVENDGGTSSFFAMQSTKGCSGNFSTKCSAEMLENTSNGFIGVSGSEMGIRRKSFADILQGGIRQPHFSASGSYDALTSIGISSNHEGKLDYMLPGETIGGLNTSKSIESSKSGIFTPGISSSSMNPQTECTPSFLNLGREVVHHSDGLNPVGMGGAPPNSSSSGIFEIAASLSELDISTNHISRPSSTSMSCFNGSYRADDPQNLVRNLQESCFDVSASDRASFPRRTYSTSELPSLHSTSEFSGFEDLKPRFRSNNLHSLNISRDNNHQSGCLIDIHHNRMIHNDLNSGPCLNNRGMIQVPATNTTCQTQQVLNRERDSIRFFDHVQAMEKAYLETMLLKEMHQYHSHFLQKSGSPSSFITGNASYGGSFSSNSQVGSRIHMRPNEEPAEFLPNVRGMKAAESACFLDSKSGSNVKGKFESLLQSLKNDKRKSLELSNIHGHVVEFSLDQGGSRFIQQKLETATIEGKMKMLAEIIPHAHGLMIDVFGNYVIQKFLQHGTESLRNELAKRLVGHVLSLSLHTYGCRVVQKALEVLDGDLKVEIAKELDGSVVKCVHDQNGNHVIQKCIECVPQDHIRFIISSFLGHVVNFSMHPYGCRVIQRILEHFDDPEVQQMILDEIIGSVCKLSQDQYGNYVIQHIVQYGGPEQRSAIIGQLSGQIVKMSQQKFASNVVEKCLIHGSSKERQALVTEILGTTDDDNEPLQAMMKDQFGNYVVQKVLETCSDDESRELILSRIRLHLNVLKRYTYGKHIVSRVEKLVSDV
ncbi:hypothetical protein M569_14840 [Genlisea aurea]|uniref:PUM-HD domain-containing protein n=1 Tax=Genlisea aurea TaxID=192259 RepID=S8DB81_9LAMI|nr:hypothetical protein M569_14840 [Genlisea aurea]